MGALDHETLVAIARLSRVGYSVIELVDADEPESWIIRFTNDAASAASQVDLSALVGARFLASFPAIRDSPFVGWYRQVHTTREEIEIPEIRYGDANVPEAAFRVWLSPLPDRCVLGQYVNVTLQRRAEGELRALNASLEAQVAARTEALRISRQVLREVTYAAAHDLQTPLRHIRMFTAQLREGEDRDDALTTIAEATDRITRCLGALMTYTELSSDGREDVGEVDVEAELRAAVEAAPPDTRAGVELEIVAPAGALRINGAALRTTARALLDNALRFRRRDVAHRVALRAAVEGGAIELSVRDNGIGIDPAYHERIFRPFHRLAPVGALAGEGIGLALCKVSTESAGGSITVSSAPGEGATFVVRLPVHGGGPSASS